MDGPGSTSWVTDQNGRVRGHVDYFPYGEVWRDPRSDSDGSPVHRQQFLFTAKEMDEETGLYYFGSRYFDPVRARWTAPDPALARFVGEGGKGGAHAPPNLSLYAYGYHNPLVLKDPDGNIPVDTIVDAIGLALDIWDFAKEASWKDAGSVALSAGAVFLPYVPSPRAVKILAKAVDKVSDVSKPATTVAKHADEVVDAGKAVDKLGDAAKGADRAADTKKATQVAENAKAGKAREVQAQKELEAMHPDASVQREQYLRDAKNNIVRDKATGEARRVDHVVDQGRPNGQVGRDDQRDCPKGAQIEKEARIREAGRNFVRGRRTVELVPYAEGVKTEVIRR